MNPRRSFVQILLRGALSASVFLFAAPCAHSATPPEEAPSLHRFPEERDELGRRLASICKAKEDHAWYIRTNEVDFSDLPLHEKFLGSQIYFRLVERRRPDIYSAAHLESLRTLNRLLAEEQERLECEATAFRDSVVTCVFPSTSPGMTNGLPRPSGAAETPPARPDNPGGMEDVSSWGALDLVPGIGFKGFLELGMQVSEIPATALDRCLIPSRFNNALEEPEWGVSWVFSDLGVEATLSNDVVVAITCWFDPASWRDDALERKALSPFQGKVDGKAPDELANPRILEPRERHPDPRLPMLGFDDETGRSVVRFGCDRLLATDTNRLLSVYYGSGGRVLAARVDRPAASPPAPVRIRKDRSRRRPSAGSSSSVPKAIPINRHPYDPLPGTPDWEELK